MVQVASGALPIIPSAILSSGRGSGAFSTDVAVDMETMTCVIVLIDVAGTVRYNGADSLPSDSRSKVSFFLNKPSDTITYERIYYIGATYSYAIATLPAASIATSVGVKFAAGDWSYCILAIYKQ